MTRIAAGPRGRRSVAQLQWPLTRAGHRDANYYVVPPPKKARTAEKLGARVLPLLGLAGKGRDLLEVATVAETAKEDPVVCACAFPFIRR